MLKKIIIVILICMNITLWIFYCELDKKVMLDKELRELIFKTQNEVLSLHAQTINKHSDLIINLAKEITNEK